MPKSKPFLESAIKIFGIVYISVPIFQPLVGKEAEFKLLVRRRRYPRYVTSDLLQCRRDLLHGRLEQVEVDSGCGRWRVYSRGWGAVHAGLGCHVHYKIFS